MTEQDTTPQDKTNTSQDNQNTTDNNTPDQTTTQHNAPHYITKSPQHNTKNLPLQVLEDETTGKKRLDPTWGVMTADEYRKLNGVKAPSDTLEISSHEVVRGRIMFDGREEPIIPTADQLETMLVGSTWAERTGVGLRDRTWEDMNEEEREYCRKWMMEKLCSWEGVRAIAAYMDSKKEKGKGGKGDCEGKKGGKEGKKGDTKGKGGSGGGKKGWK